MKAKGVSPRSLRFVIAKVTHSPLNVEVAEIMQGAGTNGVALRKALDLPFIQKNYDIAHVGIVRCDTIPHIRKDLFRFCQKVGVKDESEILRFMLEFASGMKETIERIHLEKLEETGEMRPLEKSLWGKK